MAAAQSRYYLNRYLSADPVLDDSFQVAPVLATAVDGVAIGHGHNSYSKSVCPEFSAGRLWNGPRHVGLFSDCNDTLCNYCRQPHDSPFIKSNTPEKLHIKRALDKHLLGEDACIAKVFDKSARTHHAPNENINRYALGSTEKAIQYLTPNMVDLRVETFRVVFLDVHNRILADETMWSGTINEVQVYPREVMRKALELDSSALILAHNHPSQVHAPSPADIDTTKKIIASAQILGVAVHDHFIISRRGFHSMRSHGSIEPWG
jgi:hypothetical protein